MELTNWRFSLIFWFYMSQVASATVEPLLKLADSKPQYLACDSRNMHLFAAPSFVLLCHAASNWGSENFYVLELVLILLFFLLSAKALRD